MCIQDLSEHCVCVCLYAHMLSMHMYECRKTALKTLQNTTTTPFKITNRRKYKVQQNISTTRPPEVTTVVTSFMDELRPGHLAAGRNRDVGLLRDFVSIIYLNPSHIKAHTGQLTHFHVSFSDWKAES